MSMTCIMTKYLVNVRQQHVLVQPLYGVGQGQKIVLLAGYNTGSDVTLC